MTASQLRLSGTGPAAELKRSAKVSSRPYVIGPRLYRIGARPYLIGARLYRIGAG